MLLTTTWFGTFLINTESGKITKKKLFPKKFDNLVERLELVQNQKILKEEKALVKSMKTSFNVSDERLLSVSDLVDSVESVPESVSLAPDEFGFNSELYHDAVMELGKRRMRAMVPKDQCIVQTVKGLDDLTQIANLLSERLHEWYGLHWPELTKMVKENEYIDLISQLGDMESILENTKNEKLKGFKPADSVGTQFDQDDKDAVMGFASELKTVHDSKASLEDYINVKMEALAPNITALTGPIIGARLIALTNGLARLAQVSSSTIQLLGAEKALFRHLKTGELPPKHGIIFQHNLVHNSPYWQRGKVARAFAGKIAIAAKVDYNNGQFMGEQLAEVLKRRVDEIRKKYPQAPAKKKRSKGGRERTGKKTWRGKRGKHRRGKKKRK